jgi:3',5'-cyclic-AMP phosphodiesterase
MSVLRLVQFTDPHLYGSETESLRGVQTFAALSRTLANAQRSAWPVDAVLVTGDIVQDDPAGYVHFRRLFSGAGVPVLCIPGNHDDPEALRRELDREPFVVGGRIDFGPWRIVLLDTWVAASAGGRLSTQSLAHLDESLRTAAGRHALVCLHHHPVSMSSHWLDAVGLENAAEFWRILDQHRNVRAVVWGHVHQSFDALRGNVRLLATPSTCAQFQPGTDEFAIDSLPPAYRTLQLRADGTLTTEVVWIEECAVRSSSSVSSAA